MMHPPGRRIIRRREPIAAIRFVEAASDERSHLSNDECRIRLFAVLNDGAVNAFDRLGAWQQVDDVLVPQLL
jgi:hypothetical protein